MPEPLIAVETCRLEAEVLLGPLTVYWPTTGRPIPLFITGTRGLGVGTRYDVVGTRTRGEISGCWGRLVWGETAGMDGGGLVCATAPDAPGPPGRY